MAYDLIYSSLPEDIDLWEGFPLSLSDDEVMPLDYRAGRKGWILYGKSLCKRELSKFQRKLKKPIVVVSAWKIRNYQIVHIAGDLSLRTKKIIEEFSLDFTSIDTIPTLNSPGLLVLDMDSTAIQIECIDEIAKAFGVGCEVSKITESAMKGELDYVTSLKTRIETLKNAPVSILDRIKEDLPLTSGLTFLVRELRKRDWLVAIASGGFTYYTDFLKEKLKLTETLANELEIRNEKLTGNIVGNVIDSKAKAQFLIDLANKHKIPLSQTVAIGDGANDINMIQAANLGIAFHAKPKLNKKSKALIQFADLTGVFCILSASLNNEQ